MTEIIFLIERSSEAGYVARALSASIYTEADTLDELQVMINDAVTCHFVDDEHPQNIQLHFVCTNDSFDGSASYLAQ
jgi:hypothetical protein